MTKGMKVLGVKEGEDEQVIEEEVRAGGAKDRGGCSSDDRILHSTITNYPSLTRFARNPLACHFAPCILFSHPQVREPKRKGVSGLFATANPNAGVVKNIKIKDMNSAAAAPLSRKEREAKEKEAAAERYRARHAAGLTEEYKKDMARLEEVKRRREEARDKEEEKKRLEEETAEEIRKQKERMASKVEKKGKEEGGLEKLDKIQIKKMKPAVLKEKLKERGLAIQGNAKTLVARLLDYESKR